MIALLRHAELVSPSIFGDLREGGELDPETGSGQRVPIDAQKLLIGLSGRVA
jgi:hypothetical protein